MFSLSLIRHGATEANLRKEYLGSRDPSLAEAGKVVLREKRASLELSSPSLLVLSPMQRCLETAEIYFPGQEGVLLPEWRERDFGPYEGKRWVDLKDQEEYRLWIDSAGAKSPEGMEGLEDFQARIRVGMDKIGQWIKKEAAKMKEGSEEGAGGAIRVVAVIHGGSIMEIMRLLRPGEDYYRYQLGNGGMIELISENGEEWKVGAWHV